MSSETSWISFALSAAVSGTRSAAIAAWSCSCTRRRRSSSDSRRSNRIGPSSSMRCWWMRWRSSVAAVSGHGVEPGKALPREAAGCPGVPAPPACWPLMRSDSDTAHSRGLWYGGISAADGSPAATLFGGNELVGELLDRLADARLRRVQHHRLALVHRLRHDHVAGDQRVGTELEGPLHLAD